LTCTRIAGNNEIEATVLGSTTRNGGDIGETTIQMSIQRGKFLEADIRRIREIGPAW